MRRRIIVLGTAIMAMSLNMVAQTLTVSYVVTPETCGRENGTITLTVNSTAPASIVYYWADIHNDTTLSTRIGLKAGTYSVHIKDSLSFENVTIVVDHLPAPVANFEANLYNMASNTIFTLSDLSQGTVRNWNWDMDDGNTQTGKIVYYTYSATGDYRVQLQVIDDNGCTDTISKIIHVYDVNVTSLAKEKKNIQVYPNPTTGQLTIENGELTIKNVEIYNLVGQLLQSKIVNLQSEIILDISHLANGLYFLKIDGKTVKFVKK